MQLLSNHGVKYAYAAMKEMKDQVLEIYLPAPGYSVQIVRLVNLLAHFDGFYPVVKQISSLAFDPTGNIDRETERS